MPKMKKQKDNWEITLKVLLVLIGIVLLASCSVFQRTPEKLVEVAKRRNPGVILCKKDTVKVIIEKEVASIVAEDSLEIDNNRINIKVKAKGRIFLDYTLKEVAVDVIETNPDIKRKPTWQEVNADKQKNKQAEKTNRKEIEEDGKTERAADKQAGKTDRKEAGKGPALERAKNKKKWWDKFWIGALAVSVLFLIKNLIITLWKKLFTLLR